MIDKREDRTARLVAQYPEAIQRLMTVDYADLERRVLAAAGNGADPHVESASIIYGVPTDQVTKEQRRAGCAVNYGILYNMRHDGDKTHLACMLAVTVTGRKPTQPEMQNVPPKRS